ncbi:MAG: 2-amino-4-hydroxy-6-hydroxymethyldihydropteridine diphosphokinase [Chloroflexi bacterium]|nr:2-amino-4-hydroxy-6-hydroxymethyldihydropteridine diphosphokinase [Chloroflexota bacterium]MDA1219900.1 2-amino-4-hydroxy-6-hydroxymethyldihydropteridine diphosphokinase [Chloroflexota bacterium]
MAPVTAYLGLGTNLGSREINLSRAVQSLTTSQTVQIVRSSSIYETAPWGYTEQPNFLNCVVEVNTWLSPVELLELAKQIENDLGREENFRYGPRLIDIDILLYGNDTVHLCHPDLEIPHPRIAERAFVLVPLSELAPDIMHPTLNISLAHLSDNVEGKEDVMLWGPPLDIPERL